MSDYSPNFYRKHAQQYARVAHQYLQSVYIKASHPRLKGDLSLLQRLKELAPGQRGLDAGCGAGARDVFSLWQDGYEMWGVDAIPENIKLARKLHPEISDRVKVHDLREPLPFPEAHFDFVMCNAVIQHIAPEIVYSVVLPELGRVLRPQGVLQLMFKNGEGIQTVYDKDYDVQRTFLLFDEHKLLRRLRQFDLRLIEAREGKLGGIMYFTDPKPMEHCVFYMRKGQLPTANRARRLD
jgi:SAM-dependent methyltransferase